jgi:uncharacterized damage-inducible protein DinB
MRRTCIALIVLVAAVATARAQQPPQPQNTRDVLLASWTGIGDKVVRLAEEFPENKYDFKPADGVRTFADTLRHVAFWNQFVAKAARGEKPDGTQNELPKAQYATKAAIVAALKASLADATAELKKFPASPEPKGVGLVVSFVGHSSEHYGQLVVYYRLNGLVPPASRGSNSRDMNVTRSAANRCGSSQCGVWPVSE